MRVNGEVSIGQFELHASSDDDDVVVGICREVFEKFLVDFIVYLKPETHILLNQLLIAYSDLDI